jgi:hypothetical protein
MGSFEDFAANATRQNLARFGGAQKLQHNLHLMNNKKHERNALAGFCSSS